MADRALTRHTEAWEGMKPWEIILHVALSSGLFIVMAVSEHLVYAMPAVFVAWFVYLCGTLIASDEDEPMLRRVYEQRAAEN